MRLCCVVRTCFVAAERVGLTRGVPPSAAPHHHLGFESPTNRTTPAEEPLLQPFASSACAAFGFVHRRRVSTGFDRMDVRVRLDGGFLFTLRLNPGSCGFARGREGLETSSRTRQSTCATRVEPGTLLHTGCGSHTPGAETGPCGADGEERRTKQGASAGGGSDRGRYTPRGHGGGDGGSRACVVDGQVANDRHARIPYVRKKLVDERRTNATCSSVRIRRRCAWSVPLHRNPASRVAPIDAPMVRFATNCHRILHLRRRIPWLHRSTPSPLSMARIRGWFNTILRVHVSHASRLVERCRCVLRIDTSLVPSMRTMGFLRRKDTIT